MQKTFQLHPLPVNWLPLTMSQCLFNPTPLNFFCCYCDMGPVIGLFSVFVTFERATLYTTNEGDHCVSVFLLLFCLFWDHIQGCSGITPLNMKESSIEKGKSEKSKLRMYVGKPNLSLLYSFKRILYSSFYSNPFPSWHHLVQ